MLRYDWRRTLDLVDRRLRNWMAAHGILLLRWSLGIVFLWFGALKFVPGLSSAEPMATVTMTKLCFGVLQPDMSRVLLAAWESAIGLGLLAGRWLRGTLLLMGLQMLGTMAPLILLPSITWEVFPLVPSMEGQYILKNLVLISSALTIGATVRGGVLPTVRRPPESTTLRPEPPKPRSALIWQQGNPPQVGGTRQQQHRPPRADAAPIATASATSRQAGPP